ASQHQAKERESRMALLRSRDVAAAEHRRRAEALERELQDLRPARFWQVAAPRAAALTEGEILSGLKQATGKFQSLATKFRSAGSGATTQRAFELRNQSVALQGQVLESVKAHARLELDRLEAAGAAVADSVATLLDVARARNDLLARGLSPEVEGLYSIAAVPRRSDMRQLRAALSAAEAAWQEATATWCAASATEEGGSGFSQKVAQLKAADAPAVLRDLEAARGRIAQCLARLQRAGPDLYELAFLDGGEAGEIEASAAAAVEEQLPHGWEAHLTEDDLLYYHSLVSGETQWEMPAQDAAVSAGWRLFQAEDGGWFYHNPYNGEGVWWPELPTCAAEPASLDALRREAAAHS
ncbi:unnamed protein product, partial [Polarella glacialis]